MQDFRLANILLEYNDRSNDYRELYCRTTKPLVLDEDGQSFLLFPYEKYDFATFFNLFSSVKWRKYTTITNVKLHLEIKGNAEITIVQYATTLAQPKRTAIDRIKVDHDSFTTIDYDFEDSFEADFLSFEILTMGLCSIKNSYYYSSVGEGQIRPVELALATTTFKQEAFIKANIDLFKRDIIHSGEEIADHFTMHVMDNGRTLDVSKLESDNVYIHPNKNVGGAGGFTRGMIEAMEQDTPATHVLLMDDDVQISPESLKRTFNVLSLVNDEYKRAFVSGIMLSYEAQNEMYEDIGWVRSDGMYGPVKQAGANACWLGDVVRNENTAIQKPNKYAGWWYCCIPVSNIKDYGLPLPIFIRGDDAEYGNRAAEKFITMNGICIWHLTLALKYRAHLERYQVPRNSLIAQATTGVYPDVDFMKQWKHNVQLDIKTFNYDSADLSLDALEDYLKGPEFIMQDLGQKLVMEKIKKNETLTPLSEINDPRLEFLVINPNEFFFDGGRSFLQRLTDYVTYSGHRLPDFMLKDELGVIPWDGWFYPAQKIRKRKALLVVSKDGKDCIIRTMDKKRFKVIMKRYKRLVKAYENNKSKVSKQYADARAEMTSLDFWKKYLEI